MSVMEEPRAEQDLTEQPQARPGKLPMAGKILVAVLLLCEAFACFVGARPSLEGKVDLRPFYAAGAIVRSGQVSRLYDYDYQRQVQDALVGPRAGALPFLYPPFAALLFVPLSLLPYRDAFFVQAAANLALLFAASLLLRPWLPALGQRSRALLPALYGCLFAVSVALMQGQISFVLLVICCGSYALLRRGSSFLAGLVLSLALMKFQLALPVFLLFLVWRRWRFVRGFVAGAACAAGVSWAMVGSAGLATYWSSLFGIASQSAANAAAAKVRYGMSPSEMPNLHGLAYGLSQGAHWGQWLNVVLCVLVLVWAARQSASMLVALPAAMLVSYHMQPHDLTLLLLPLSFILDDALGRMLGGVRTTPPQPRNFGIALVCALLLLTFPLEPILMAHGIHYFVVAAVAISMVLAARRESSFAGIGCQQGNPGSDAIPASVASRILLGEMRES
ncbi:MAG: glycosyltransferase family 87 protein [Acidobacteriaceae bacterium]